MVPSSKILDEESVIEVWESHPTCPNTQKNHLLERLLERPIFLKRQLGLPLKPATFGCLKK